jgi:hypothetical protein
MTLLGAHRYPCPTAGGDAYDAEVGGRLTAIPR